MKTSVHLTFLGTCEEAFSTYARLLEGTVVYSLRYGDSPAANQVPADWQDKLYHSTLTLADLTLSGGDVLAINYRALEGVSLIVNPDSPEDAHRIFDGLANGGVVEMPLQEVFWSPAFGVLRDRFGVPWMINCEPTEEAA